MSLINRIKRMPLDTPATDSPRTFERERRRAQMTQQMTGEVQRVALAQSIGTQETPKVPSYVKRHGVR